MVAMKHFILLLLIFLCLSPLPLRREASAEDSVESYAVAAQTDVWFYSAENEESGLFVLPYTYYVKVLRRGTLYTAVQYMDDIAPYKSITGYCKTDALTFVDFIPERPYLRREITVSYAVENSNGLLMGKGAFDKIEKNFIYYGTSYLGTARYYYVYADGIFDYVPATQEILYDLNTDYLQSSGAVDNGEETQEPEAKSGLSALQIAIICAAGLALAAIAVFALRGKKPVSAPQELSEF